MPICFNLYYCINAYLYQFASLYQFVSLYQCLIVSLIQIHCINVDYDWDFCLRHPGFKLCLQLLSQSDPQTFFNPDTQISSSVKWDTNPAKRSLSRLSRRSVTISPRTTGLLHRTPERWHKCTLSFSLCQITCKRIILNPFAAAELGSRSWGAGSSAVSWAGVYLAVQSHAALSIICFGCDLFFSSLCRWCTVLNGQRLGLSFSPGWCILPSDVLLNTWTDESEW